MSQFFSSKYKTLEPYTPGEQPKERKYVKLNTNESPFPPSPGVLRAVAEESGRLQLYSDPDCKRLTAALARRYGVGEDQILLSNGSDEVLNFAFQAFADEEHPLVFPDLTYGFYPVFAALNRIPYREIPLREDFSICPEDYHNLGMNIVIANPNAPTGRALSLGEIEGILQTNREHVVVIDEAYVDFGGQTCIPLIEKYDNLLVTRTFSKSYSLAGARLGFGAGSEALIADLNAIKYSTNPYNINRMTMAAGVAALESNHYYRDNCRKIMDTRDRTAEELRGMGFDVVPSTTNFLLAGHPAVTGKILYEKLRERGILVRYFARPDVEGYVRITIGTHGQMAALTAAAKEIVKEETP